MSPIPNSRYVFKNYFTGYPEVGKSFYFDDSQTIDLDNVSLNGGVLLKTLALSIDPYLRGKMNEPNGKHYVPAYQPGETLYGEGVAKVIASENKDLPVGVVVFGSLDFTEYQVKTDVSRLEILDNKYNIPWTAWTGVLGMPGMTAYYGWREYNGAKKGDVAFITTGAGQVGSLVVQLAKLDGLKVISSAGSEEKVKLLEDLGTDVAFNYKTTSTRDVLAKEGPINVFWDNVGGEILEAAIDASAVGAHFIECGAISEYNNEVPYHVKNLGMIFGRQLKLFGYLYVSLAPKWHKEFRQELPKLVSEGKIKYTEDVRHGIKEIGQAIIDQQTGKNHGKVVIKVSEA